jgi:hypothetical protein
MAGYGYESIDLLNLFNRYAGRPEGDLIPDSAKYDRLAKAQDKVLMYIMATCPRVLYQGPTAMTSADGGYTWTFGTDDNGYAIFPLGNAQIYPTLSAYPSYPWVPGADYLDLGTSVKMPANTPWGGSLYWVGVIQPEAITGNVDPFMDFAREFMRDPGLVDEMQRKWNEDWPVHITAIRKHFRGSQSLGPLSWPYAAGISGIGGIGL